MYSLGIYCKRVCAQWNVKIILILIWSSSSRFSVSMYLRKSFKYNFYLSISVYLSSLSRCRCVCVSRFSHVFGYIQLSVFFPYLNVSWTNSSNGMSFVATFLWQLKSVHDSVPYRHFIYLQQAVCSHDILWNWQVQCDFREIDWRNATFDNQIRLI